MRRTKHQVTIEEDLFVGIDLHKIRWHVTIRTMELELFSASIPGTWEALQRVLARYAGHRLPAVYEAGYFGFRLHDRLVAHGIPCIVTPPSLVPQEYGNRVKTDRRDSSKLARLLAKGLLKRVWVPSEEELYHRQVIRRRRQLVRDRVRTQRRIKAELRFYGIHLEEPRGRWTQMYFETLRGVTFGDRWMQESFNRLLEQYEFLSMQIDKQTQSATGTIRDCTVPGAGGDFAEHPRYRDNLCHGTAPGTTGRIPLPTGRTTGGLRRFDPVPVLQCG